MKLSEELKWRGFANQYTFADLKELDQQEWTLYLGADVSASSLHIGHLAVYMMVRRFLDHGHKVVLLIGGGTGLIGDPRDTEEREILSLENGAKNAQALTAQVSRLFDGQEFTLVNNHDWLKALKLIDFLRDVGKHFSMGQLVDREYFKARVGQGKSGLSFAEFSYTLMQGYDFWYLHHKHGVNLQIGGSDQWGNILSGVELIRKKDGVEVGGMTAPLVINRETGRKFGKSEAGNTIWLDAEQTSPYEFYQFLLNVGDDSAVDYLKIFTLLTPAQIEEIVQKHQAEPSARLAQKTLAQAVTEIVHGRAVAAGVIKVTRVLFEGGDVKELSSQELALLSGSIPNVTLGSTIVQALVQSELASSNGEALRLIKGKAISVNGNKVSSDAQLKELSLIKKGKNSFVLVK